MQKIEKLRLLLGWDRDLFAWTIFSKFWTYSFTKSFFSPLSKMINTEKTIPLYGKRFPK